MPNNDMTLTGTVSGFQRGDLITVTGCVNSSGNNGTFAVRRARSTELLVGQPTLWEYIRHYGRRIAMWAKWHWYGFVDGFSDAVERLRSSWRGE